jgi:hypothetical protein
MSFSVYVVFDELNTCDVRVPMFLFTTLKLAQEMVVLLNREDGENDRYYGDTMLVRDPLVSFSRGRGRGIELTLCNRYLFIYENVIETA